MLDLHEQHFKRFAVLVNGIRNAQLNGDPSYTFENKYIFHIEKTDIHAGAYLKCGNGTIALSQRFGITTTDTKRVSTARWYSAKTEKNITVIPREGVAYKTLTIGLAYGFKMAKPEGHKHRPRHRHHDNEPDKDRPAPKKVDENATRTDEV